MRAAAVALLFSGSALSFVLPSTNGLSGSCHDRLARAPRHNTPLMMSGRRFGGDRNAPTEAKLPPMNEKITAPMLRLLVNDGKGNDEMVGVVTLEEGLEKARELGVDLVLISPDADPPVAKVIDYGKLAYAAAKKKKDQQKAQKVNEIKEVKMSYKIGVGDYQTRLRATDKFLKAGNRVKVHIQFKGREQQHMELGSDLLKKLNSDLAEGGISVLASRNLREGNRLTSIFSLKT